MIIETLYLYLHIINSGTNLTTMKKQEMINVIMLEERALYESVQECIEHFGVDNIITETAITRWSVVNKLLKKLGL